MRNVPVQILEHKKYLNYTFCSILNLVGTDIGNILILKFIYSVLLSPAAGGVFLTTLVVESSLKIPTLWVGARTLQSDYTGKSYHI